MPENRMTDHLNSLAAFRQKPAPTPYLDKDINLN